MRERKQEERETSIGRSVVSSRTSCNPGHYSPSLALAQKSLHKLELERT